MDRRLHRHLAVSVVLAMLLGLAAGPAAAASDADKARKKLEKHGFEFTADKFCDAARDGKKDIVELFLQAGMSPTEPDRFEDTPLGQAIQHSQIPIVEMLLAAGADLTVPLSRFNCDAVAAALDVHGPTGAQILKLVLKAGGSLQSTCARPLYNAMTSDDADQVTMLLQAGASVDAPEQNGETPLHLAAEWGKNSVLPVLLHAGAKVDARDHQQATPLIFAARGGQPQALEALLAAGADANATDFEGETALIEVAHLTAEGPNASQTLLTAQLRMLQDLLRAGAKVNAQNGRGMGAHTALIEAAANGQTDLVRALISAGADVNLAGSFTALMEAAKAGHKDVVRLLLEHGADVTPKDIGGRTALDWAADDPEVAELLKAKGARTASKYADQPTPAVQAERVTPQQRDRAVAVLKSRGYRQVDQQSLFQAALAGDAQSVRLFIEAGLSPDTKDPRDHSTTALVLAASFGKTEVVEALLDAGANPNADEGMPLIHAAGNCGMNAAVSALIDHGADVDARAPGGQTPLGAAKLYNCELNEATLRQAGAKAELALPGARDKSSARPAAKGGKKVQMPDYWAKLKVGDWSEFKSEPGHGIETRMKWTVRKVTPEKVVYLVEMSTYANGRLLMNGQPTEIAYDKTNVLTDPDATVTTTQQTVTLKGQTLNVTIYKTEGVQNGTPYSVNSWMSDQVPFGLVKLESGGAVSHQLVDWGFGP